MMEPMTTQSLQKSVIKKTLANGLTVLLKEDHSSPIVAVNVWFGVGSVNETEEINGLAHFQEHMVFKGTEKYGVGEIANIVKSVGGNLNAGTSFSYTMYYIVVPSDAFSTALEVQADAMMHSTIDPDEFVSSVKVFIDNSVGGYDNPPEDLWYRVYSDDGAGGTSVGGLIEVTDAILTAEAGGQVSFLIGNPLGDNDIDAVQLFMGTGTVKIPVIEFTITEEFDPESLDMVFTATLVDNDDDSNTDIFSIDLDPGVA